MNKPITTNQIGALAEKSPRKKPNALTTNEIQPERSMRPKNGDRKRFNANKVITSATVDELEKAGATKAPEPVSKEGGKVRGKR